MKLSVRVEEGVRDGGEGEKVVEDWTGLDGIIGAGPLLIRAWLGSI